MDSNMDKKNHYLTIHGHFYQPPRENPWLESIELQDSALPFHDWNERISHECYNPNSVSRIVDNKNKIIDIVNNYSLMSFNFGPTLMSWLKDHATKTYERIIKADRQSVRERSGHGNAIAQAYNHMIMPLANKKDKYTQTIWGIKDFQNRFGRYPEAMWLAETAIDDETIEVLIDCGIKFTILSPYQAEKIRPLDNKNASWCDVSWGNIDPAKAYRYFLKSNPEKYIDLFFYDGAISKSVAFDGLLKDGEKFIKRLQEGVSENRNYNQLVNIGTDGESYGHHTKFGDMALSYIQKMKAEAAGFILTNYGEYLEKEPPLYEVDIKQASSWSCFHNVGRWSEDCGCSTGGQPGWNQKWRKPLRDALNNLRDELMVVFEENATKYLKDPWQARNNYIDVILDRNEMTINKFLKQEQVRNLSIDEKIKVIKLFEMQRQAMLMFTSCGWFFSEISGIETVQIMKYAAKAIQLAGEFSKKDLENPFLDKLAEAKSNIQELGNGKDVYKKFVKPSIVSVKQVVSHWAISSLFEDYEDENEIYCYNIKKIDYRKAQKGNSDLVVGRIQITSKITLEVQDMIFALIRFSSDDFHCAIREYTNDSDYNIIKSTLITKYTSAPFTEIIRTIDEHFGREYFTLRDLFIEEKRKITTILLKDKLEKFTTTYQNLYQEGKGPILELYELGVQIPAEFKIVAEYTLSKSFNDIIKDADDITDPDVIQSVIDINNEAKKLGAVLNKTDVTNIFSDQITRKISKLAKSVEADQSKKIFEILRIAKEIEIDLDLSEAQNIYYNCIYNQIPEMIKSMSSSGNIEYDKELIKTILNVGVKLNIDLDHSYDELNKII